MSVRLNQEQVVFLGTLALLGVLYATLSPSSKTLRGRRGGAEDLVVEPFPAPLLDTVMPPDAAAGAREERGELGGLREGLQAPSARVLFQPPSDTRALPPLDWIEPPRAGLAALFPLSDPGPFPAAFGLLRRPLAPLDAPDLFDTVENEGDGLRGAETLAGAPSVSGLETPAAEALRQAGYRERFDWIQRKGGTTIYGRLVNEDRYGLLVEDVQRSARASEALLFIEVDPETGREVFASVGAPAIALERERVQSFGLAATAANELGLARRRLGPPEVPAEEALQASEREEALALAARALELRLAAPEALALAKELYAACALLEPGDVRAARGLARAHAESFDFEGALVRYQDVAERFPRDVATQVALAELEGRFLLEDQAETRLRMALRLPSETWRARRALGRLLLSEGRAGEARELFTRAIADVPDDPSALSLRVALRTELAEAHLALGDVEEAQRLFTQAFAADPSFARAAAGRRACTLLGVPAERLADGSRIGGATGGVGLNGADGSDAAGDGEGGFALTLVSGLEAFLEGDAVRARDLFESAAQADPLRAHRAFAALSALAERAGAPEQALRFVEDALEHTPDDAWSLYQHGRLLARVDDEEAAREAFLAALAIDPDFEEALVALGDTALGLGRFEDAERYFARALALAPERADVHALRGVNALRLRDLDAARSAFDAALALDAEHSVALAGRAWWAYWNGDPTEARVQLANLDRARRGEGEEDPLRLWAREQIARLADHEEKVEWRDGFERRSLRNGWTLREGVGPLVTLQDGEVVVEGVFVEDGRTSIFREYPASRFVSFEVDVWIDPATTVRAGIFVARERQRRDANDTLGEVSLSRHKDGALELAFVRQGVPTETVELPEPFPLGRWVRLRVERYGEASDARVSLYLDGIPLVEDAPFASLGRAASPLQAGVFVEGEPGRRARMRLDNATVVYRQ